MGDLSPFGFAYDGTWQEKKRSIRKQMVLRQGQQDDKGERSARNFDASFKQRASRSGLGSNDIKRTMDLDNG
jgi:hypothetical protein